MRWFSRDGAFFDIDVDGDPNTIMAEDILSMVVTEELGRMATGSISLRDPNLMYGRVIPRGAVLNISWGYVPESIGLTVRAGDLGDAIDRRNFRVYVQNPTGSADDKGQAIYNCNFVATDFRGELGIRDFSSGTKWSVVTSVMIGLGVDVYDVRFARGNEAVTEENTVRQAEPDFAFLARLSREWKTVFRVGTGRDGLAYGIFLDPENIDGSEVVKKLAQTRRGGIEFQYKVGANPNVITYTYKHHEGDSGIGDAVTIEYVNGEPTFVRRTIEQETISVWKLSQERVDAEFQRRADEGGVESQAQFVREILAAKQFEQVQHLFDLADQETAPNGIGWTVTLKTLGDTGTAPGLQALFGVGFPDVFVSDDEISTLGGGTRERIGDRPVKFYIQKVTHTLNNSGYYCDVEVVDMYAESPTGVEAVGSGGLLG